MERLISVWALVFVRPMLLVGALIALIGIGLVVFAGSYFAMGAFSESNLDELNVTQSETGLTDEDLTRGLAPPGPNGTIAASSTPTSASDAAIAATPSPAPAPTDPTSQQSTTPSDSYDDPTPVAADDSDDGPYDEYGILRDYSHYLAVADDGTLLRPITENFTAVTRDDLVSSYGREPKPAHIIIPAIDLESDVIDLNIVMDGENTEWQTADHAVGYHVGSATPGEIGNMVLSGHVNSPFAGEGSVFARLDEVAPMLRRGEIVDIMVMAGGDVFLYRATDTTVVLPKEVTVFDYSDGPTLSLVTCAPANTYSHRFIVNATLVGVARL